MNSLTTKSNQPVNPVGIGTWNIASRIHEDDLGSKYRGVEAVYGNEDQEIEAIRYSISKGQNHIDSAEMYGGFYTDEVIGRAIAGLPREDLYIGDKLWKTSVAKGTVRATVEAMLKKLGTDYLDLLYIHNSFDDAPWREAIPQIDELIDEGLVRQFGVSNFSVAEMQEAMAIAKHPLAVNQMYCNILHQQEVDTAFRDFCEQNNILIVAYRPLELKEVLDDSVIKDVAKQHNASPAQIALAWLMHYGMLPIPKAIDKKHIDDNLGALDIVLTAEDLQKLTK